MVNILKNNSLETRIVSVNECVLSEYQAMDSQRYWVQSPPHEGLNLGPLPRNYWFPPRLGEGGRK